MKASISSLLMVTIIKKSQPYFLNNQKYLGKTVPVLIEDKSDKEDKYMGYTDTMKLVNVDCDEKYLGKIVNVKLEKCHGFYYIGSAVEE